MNLKHTTIFSLLSTRRRDGLVVERRTPEREVGVRFSLRSPCCILEQDTFTSPKSTGNTQVAVAPSRHD